MGRGRSPQVDQFSPAPRATGDVPLLTASEVAEYTFCPEAWYLRRHQVAPSPDDDPRLERGAAAHRALGRMTDRIRLATTLRRILLVAMALVSLLLVAQLAGLVNQ